MNRDWYYEIQTAYRKEIGEVYTRVPKDQIPRLAELCENTPAESLEEITAFILSTLQENAVYTQMPGLFPINEDPVEYFLFEGGEGYCQHFASAAILMYRLYGIPARYAAGYAIPPSSFSKQADGSYLAEVTDEAAHAWPEIFLEGYGWVPIEVTPSVSGIIPVYPGMDQVQLEQLLTAGIPSRAEAGQDEERPGREMTEISQESFSAGQSAENFPDFLSKETVTEITLYLLLLFILLFFLHKSFRREAIAFLDVQGLYAEIVKTVHFAGFLTEYDSSDTDFIHRLPEVVPGLTHQQAQELLAVVQEAAFGNRPLEKSIENDIRIMYEQIVRTVYHGLPVWKKVIFWIAV